MILRVFRGDKKAVFSIGCRQPVSTTSYCFINRIGETAIGTKGHGDAGWLQPTNGTRWNYPRNNHDRGGFVQEHIDQAEAMRKGKKFHNGWRATVASMTGVMGRMATYSGQEIKWDDAVARGKSLFPYDVELTFDTVPPVTIGPDGTYEHAVAVPGEYAPFDPS